MTLDPMIIGVIGLVGMILLLLVGVPVAWAMAAAGIVGNVIFAGLPQTAAQVTLIVWENGTNFLLIALPLFLLMGQLVYRTGIATDLYACLHMWLGRLPGGLAIATVVANAAFGAVTGSSVAATATMSAIVMPEFRRYGYDPKLATGTLAAAGTLAMLIPPSLIMVVYGVWSETSIGALFIAGIVPGILMAIAFCTMILVRCIVTPSLGPRGPVYPRAERIRSLIKLLPTAIVFFIVLGGIYFGIFTPTEASGFGVIGVLLVALAYRRLTKAAVAQAMTDTATLSASLFAIVVGGVLLSRFLVHTEITQAIVGWIGGGDVSPNMVILMLALMYLALGALMDSFGMLILTLPFVMPVILTIGFDPVWFGVFIVLMVELALITPPVGLNVFVAQNMAKEVPLEDVFRGAMPFVAVCLVMVVLLVLFPQIALWLPSTMLGR